jgi:DegV family protein with EDD domain
MSISSKISSTYGVAASAAERVREEIPSACIYCFDSYRMAGAFGLLVAYAHALKKEGKSFDEVISWLEENKNRVHQMGPIDDLIFVARRGRITMGKAIMGSFAGVKPMGDCSSDGYVSVLSKVKGIKKALEATVKYVEKMATHVEEQYLVVSHSHREAYANTLASMLSEKIPVRKIFVSDVFSASGTNIGPGMIAVYFLGEKISENQEAEKQALIEILKQ